MTTDPETRPVDAGTVKYLRVLVTVLTATMILGVIVIVILFVIRFSDAFGPNMPEGITLPDGTEPAAYTVGAGWYAVVTEDDRILIFDGETGTLRRTITIEQGRTRQ